jgi:Holliday junction resolvase RusA-like endonuclease
MRAAVSNASPERYTSPLVPSFTFKCIPLPPSSNNQYSAFVRGGRVVHVPAKVLVTFKADIRRYFESNAELMLLARASLAGYPLAIHADFKFERTRLFTKKGTFKRLDVSNRLKALHDMVCEMLHIDDSAFVSISARKLSVAATYLEGVDIEIGACDFEERG